MWPTYLRCFDALHASILQTFKLIARRQIDSDFFMARLSFLLTKYDKYITAERAARSEEHASQQFRTISSCPEVLDVWGGPVPEETYEHLLSLFLVCFRSSSACAKVRK